MSKVIVTTGKGRFSHEFGGNLPAHELENRAYMYWGWMGIKTIQIIRPK